MTKKQGTIANIIQKLFLCTHCTKSSSFIENPYNNLRWENIYVYSQDCVKIGFWVLHSPNPKGCFMILHGNATNRVTFTKGFKLDRFVTGGWTIVIPDYREYGDSEGVFEVNTVNYYIKAVHDYCKTIIKMNPVIIGFSLGGAIALEYSKFTNYPDKLILISTFSSSLDILHDQWLYRITKYFFPGVENDLTETFNYQSDNSIMCLAPEQVFILHGRKDTLIKIKHSQKLIERLGCQYHFFERDDHLSIMTNHDLLDVIEGFLQKNTP